MAHSTSFRLRRFVFSRFRPSVFRYYSTLPVQSTREQKKKQKRKEKHLLNTILESIYRLDPSSEMPGIHTVCIAILLAVVLLYDRCFGYPSIRQRQGLVHVCESCADSCDKCEYGVVMSVACGVPQCAKGPDQLCGGHKDIFGICGEGMHCNCNKCIGCSSDEFECSKKDPCLPGSLLQFSHFDRFGRLPTAV
ncbi:queen brain-selective protein-1 isoform X2 [Osmia lignaria lignaria]|uniref:queen brain-selective protein-1 isoform X2 n=1 Tax=Osmia lignaria lignaria TaxID=1437193 RepID=UPI00147928F1|nr:neuroparsin-A-like isoform X2 [Osmia lignaria]